MANYSHRSLYLGIALNSRKFARHLSDAWQCREDLSIAVDEQELHSYLCLPGADEA